MKNGAAVHHEAGVDEGHKNGSQQLSHGLSKRGSKALTPFSSYIQAVNDAKGKQWSPTKPDGYFLMATAESVLSFDLIHEKIRGCREVPDTVGLYENFRGGDRLRTALARMMERTFMGVRVIPSNLCISSGVTAVLDLFFFATCDVNDGCLIPAPYFPAFDNDLKIRNEVQPIPVQPSDTRTYIPTADEMERAAVAAEKKGITPRILLVTNPGNPLGTLYPESTLKELLIWALNRGLHVLCDEIYANSKFGVSPIEFISMEKVASIAVSENLVSDQVVAQRVHTVYGMSKDFGMSGFRVGCIHTRNKDMQKFWQNMGMFAAVSSDTQHALSMLLEDEDFVDNYVCENNRRLKKSYELFTSGLREANIQYMPACAAMFCWLDLRKLLCEATFESEDQLWKEIRDKCHIILTPGQACHYAEPGFFRACYASMPPANLKVAVERLASFSQGRRGKRKAQDVLDS
ncbi:unnamed protein product [Calypogeia fissa]